MAETLSESGTDAAQALAAVKRETGGWKMPLVMAGYLFALAYATSFVTYRVVLALGAG